jgi:hypothetical protein
MAIARNGAISNATMVRIYLFHGVHYTNFLDFYRENDSSSTMS